jgi:hypothetical protein
MTQRSSLTLMTTALLCLAAFNSARADETLNFRLVMHAASVETQEVGDVDGHVLGLARQSGLALFPDGSVGTSYFTSTNDYIKGAGTNLTYYNVTFKDGSVLWYKAIGTAKPDGTTTIFLEGRLSVLGGKGRFEGAKGDGTWTGARLAALAIGAEVYVDVVINVKK